MSDKCTQVFIQSHWQNIYICLWVDIDAKSKTQSVLNYLVFTLYIHNDKWRPWKYEWNKINKQGEKDAASTWKRLGVCHAASIGIKKSGLSASTIPFIIICTYKNGGICVLHLMCYVLLCTMLLRFSYLFSMEPWAAVKKSFKLVWQCHQLLSGFIANDHLPRVSSQSCLSANYNDKHLLYSWEMLIFLQNLWYLVTPLSYTYNIYFFKFKIYHLTFGSIFNTVVLYLTFNYMTFNF